jgi:acetylornithine deacetylase
MSLENAVKQVCDMVAIPSVNPMGRPVKGDIYLESQLADFVEGKMKSLGMDVEKYEVMPGRPNVVGVMQKQGKPILLLDSHLDTVPVEGMASPFDPVIKNHQILGRGSCDTKASMAMFLTALEELKNEGKELQWSIVLAGTVDEELHAKGAHALVKKGLRPALAILGEPTELNMIHAHKGAVRFHIETFGKSCHSSMPHLGKNAIYTMSEILLKIKTMGDLQLPKIKNAELGSPTINPGTITGGISVNAVPDYCMIDVDFRTIPGQSVTDVFDLLKIALKDIDPADYKINSPHLDAMAMYTAQDSPYSKLLCRCCRKFHPASEFQVASYATDAQAFSPIDTPALVFGPGSIKVAHTINEFLPISELEISIKIMKEFLMSEAHI